MRIRLNSVHAMAGAFAVTLLAIALANCGGGGGSSTNPAPTPRQSAAGQACSHTFSVARAPMSVSRLGSFGAHPPTAATEGFVPNQFAARFSTQISAQAAAVLARLGAQQISGMNRYGAVAFRIPSRVNPRRAAQALSGIPGVVAAGPIPLRRLQFTPNDPLFNNVQQWDMFAINMPNAWGITLGSTTTRIAVIDTGYDTNNPDLDGKVDLSIVYDLGTGQPDTKGSIEDTDGHGSDVSGIAAADTNNGVDVAGVGANVHLLEARVFPPGTKGEASTQDIGAAIDWAVANHANVINLSLGGATPDDTFEEPAVAAAIKAGVVVVAASGNDGMDTIDYPAADPGVIAVGASAYCDSQQNTPGSGYEYVASYSNFGSGLSLVAPGGDPDSAQSKCNSQSCIDFLQWIENLDSTKGPFTEQVGLFAGTSQATPHVSGAVGLMFTLDPGLTPAQALSTVQSTADNINDPHQGAGRLDVYNALLHAP